jgi:hypothetical protein
MSARRALALVAAALVACAAQRTAPAPSPALAPAVESLPGEPIALAPGYPELRSRFDADAARARLLVLASPT